MLDRLFGTRIHYFIHILSCVGIAVGLSFGKAILSISMLLLIANFLLEGKFKEVIQRIKGNSILLFIIGFYLLILIGVFWSNDFSLGFKELKSRLPFLVIPLIIGARNPLSTKEVQTILYFFLVGLLITSVYNYLSYTQLIGATTYNDIRGMSLFASHIRYGIIIALGVAVAFYIQYEQRKFSWYLTICILWFSYYTYYSQVLSGYLALVMVVFASLFYFSWKWNKKVTIISKLALLSIVVYYLSSFLNFEKKPINPSELEPYTVNNYKYLHSNEAFSEINLKPIFAYYCEIEMYWEWNKVSEMEYMGNDLKNHHLQTTLARYMTALDLRKDSVDFQKLTKEDIRNIEMGYTNREEKNQHLQARINGLRYQLINNEDPNGHSLLQRFEFWKTSIYLIKNNWLIGVGTGSNQKAFDEAYVKLNSKLNETNRLRSHNMYLTYFISYGIVGFLAFILLLYFIGNYSLNSNYLLGVQFILVMSTSFLIEDTLETQLGVTIFGFFTALIINWKNLNSTKVTS